MRFKDFINENIILPNFVLNTTNIKKLNDEFNDQNIFFHKANNTNKKPGGEYFEDKDEIHVYVTKYATIDSLIGVVKHELVHRIANLKSKGKLSLQNAKIIKKVNNLANEYNNSSNNSSNKKDEILKKYTEISNYFFYGKPNEQMAYALQFVKMAKSKGWKTINEALKWISLNHKVKIDNRFKKYFYSYWMVKDEL